jgi:hypothetical protein
MTLPLLEKSEAADKWVPALAGTTTEHCCLRAAIPLLHARLAVAGRGRHAAALKAAKAALDP